MGEGADAQRLGVAAHGVEVARGVEGHRADRLHVLQRRHRNEPRLAPTAALPTEPQVKVTVNVLMIRMMMLSGLQFFD